MSNHLQHEQNQTAHVPPNIAEKKQHDETVADKIEHSLGNHFSSVEAAFELYELSRTKDEHQAYVQFKQNVADVKTTFLKYLLQTMKLACDYEKHQSSLNALYDLAEKTDWTNSEKLAKLKTSFMNITPDNPTVETPPTSQTE